MVLALAPWAASAEQMVRYGKPVFHNGHRVLYHGAWRGGGGKPASRRAIASNDDDDDEDGKPGKSKGLSASAHEFIITVDTDDACATRMARELVTVLRASGVKARDWAGKVSPAALGRFVFGDGSDFAIAPMDALQADDKSADWHPKAPYLARLANEPLEIIAGARITEVQQLDGRPVSFGGADSAADSSAQALFPRLGLAPKPVHASLQASLADLAAGSIDAVIVVGADESRAVADAAEAANFTSCRSRGRPSFAGSTRRRV